MGNTLAVTYDAVERHALLFLDGDDRSWQRLRRLYEDASDQTSLSREGAIRVPWWAFLLSQKDLAYVCRRQGIAIAYDDECEQRLAAALERRDAYDAVETAPILSPEELRARLAIAGFLRTLTPEQERNVARLARAPAGATFSVPGAGKTTEALALFALHRKADTRLCVVAPKNAFAAWEEQAALCLPDNNGFVRLTGGRRNIRAFLRDAPDKSLITYQQVPNVLADLGSFVDEHETFMFLDESHRIKRGFAGVQGNAILSLSTLPERKLIMSGTPMPNDISDLLPQFRFLFPSIHADAENVGELIQPVYVRTTKKELRLPKIRHRRIEVPFKPAQHELCRLLSSEAAREARAMSIADRSRLRRIGRSALRLLQVVSNPGLLARVPDFRHDELLGEVLEEGDSSKLEAVCLRARQLAHQGQKTIIWSSFVENVEIIAERLSDLGAEYIHGQVEAGSEDEEGTREQKVKRFHDDDRCMVLVANPAACGEGISLHTVCHHAIYIDRNYNVAQYLQSEDRIHRLGLREDQVTTVEIFVCPGSIDEAVDRRLKAKIDRMADVLGDQGLRIEPVSVDLDADVDAFDDEDLADFLRHVRYWQQ